MNATPKQAPLSQTTYSISHHTVKGKGLPQQAEVAQGVPGRLRLRIFLTFGTTRVVGRQPYAPAAFTTRGNPWYSFLEAESTPGHMVPLVTTEKSPAIPLGIDPVAVRVAAHSLNHYATPGPRHTVVHYNVEQMGVLPPARAKFILSPSDKGSGGSTCRISSLARAEFMKQWRLYCTPQTSSWRCV